MTVFILSLLFNRILLLNLLLILAMNDIYICEKQRLNMLNIYSNKFEHIQKILQFKNNDNLIHY